jgi:hypothetical protein
VGIPVVGHAHESPISLHPVAIWSQPPGRRKSVDVAVSASRNTSGSVMDSASSCECTMPTSCCSPSGAQAVQAAVKSGYTL